MDTIRSHKLKGNSIQAIIVGSMFIFQGVVLKKQDITGPVLSEQMSDDHFPQYMMRIHEQQSEG